MLLAQATHFVHASEVSLGSSLHHKTMQQLHASNALSFNKSGFKNGSQAYMQLVDCMHCLFAGCRLWLGR